MTCDHAVDLMVDSLMDDLSVEERERLTAHLRTCANCVAEAEAMGWAWETLPDLAAPRPQPDASDRFAMRVAEHAVPPVWARWLQAAAAVALLVFGGSAGYWFRGDRESTPVTGATFLFLVRGAGPDATVPEETLVAEYTAWAASLAGQGRLVRGDKLTDEPGRWVSGVVAEARATSDISGYFLIEAVDYAEAVGIARASPHVRYGGTFEIRQIDRLE